jgi:hypothetical protein
MKHGPKKNNIPFTFHYATHFMLDNAAFIVTDAGQVWKYEVDNEEFTIMNNFPTLFEGFISSFLSNGKAYVVTYGQTWQYDTQHDVWIEKSPNPFQKSFYGSQSIGFAFKNTSYVLLHGQVLYKYDVANDRWIKTSVFPGCRGDNSYKTAFVIGDQAYIGAISGNYSNCHPLLYLYQD